MYGWYMIQVSLIVSGLWPGKKDTMVTRKQTRPWKLYAVTLILKPQKRFFLRVLKVLVVLQIIQFNYSWPKCLLWSTLWERGKTLCLVYNTFGCKLFCFYFVKLLIQITCTPRGWPQKSIKILYLIWLAIEKCWMDISRMRRWELISKG